MKLDVAGSSCSCCLPLRLSPLVAPHVSTSLTGQEYSLRCGAVVEIFSARVFMLKSQCSLEIRCSGG